MYLADQQVSSFKQLFNDKIEILFYSVLYFLFSQIDLSELET